MPEPSHRFHWNAFEIGAVPVHEPAEADNVCPSCAVPEIVGLAVFAGGWGGGVTVAVAVDTWVADPLGFDAVTERTTEWPVSNAVSV